MSFGYDRNACSNENTSATVFLNHCYYKNIDGNAIKIIDFILKLPKIGKTLFVPPLDKTGVAAVT